MKQPLSFIFLFLFLLHFVWAGTTGKIAGIVTDKSSGTPLPGVNITLEGIALGAASDLDGTYYIINVPVGKHSINASFIGYKPVNIAGITVEIDRTITVKFELEEDVLELGEVIQVQAERERVKKDLTMSAEHVDKEEIEVMPVESFETVAQLQAGAVGEHFRGGREYEVLPIIDGMSIKDLNAGYGHISTNRDEAFLQTTFLVPEFAIEQMQVLTGGFTAEYGNAQSAIINIITRQGGRDYRGRFNFKTSWFSHNSKRYWYRDETGEFIFPNDKALITFFQRTQPPDSLLAQGVRPPSIVNALSTTNLESFDVDNYGRQEYEFALSGPVPFSGDRLNFSMAAEFVDKDRQQLSIWGPQFQGSIQSKIVYQISPTQHLQLSGLGSWINSQSIGYFEAKFPGGYFPGLGYMPPKVDSEEYEFNRNYMATLKWNHTLSPKTFYEVQVGYTYHSFDRKTKDWNDRDGDGDFDEFVEWKMISVPDKPEDPNTSWSRQLRFTTDNTQFFWVPANEAADWEGGWQWGVPGKSYWKEVWFLNDLSEYEKEWRFVTGTLYEGELEPMPIEHFEEGFLYPEVLGGFFDVFGDGNLNYYFDNSTIRLKADLTSQITPSHLLRGGIDLAFNRLNILRVNSWGSWRIIDEYNETPIDFAAYIQDKMEYEGLIVNAGIRFDYYQAGKDLIYPGDFSAPYDLSKEPGDEGYILNPRKSKPFHTVSPRLGISHPISENAVIHFAYGHFYQRPEYRFWFQNQAYNFDRGFTGGIGNPSLRPEKTISYEAGLKQNMGQFLLSVNLFYKDIFDLTDIVSAGAPPYDGYGLWSNRDWADVRGLEITLRKFYSDYITGKINYTYMVAKGNASSAFDDFIQLGPQEPIYLDWDQRHTFNANITVSLPQDWGPAIGTFFPFADWNLNILYTYDSPLPYTPPSRDPRPDYNSKRLESRMQTNIKLSKRFNVYDRIRAIFLIEGYNIFNRKNLLWVADNEWYEVTGSPEGIYMDPSVWGQRRHFRIGVGLQF
jgi:outer membrane receptor protein involved in Fe transport